MFSLLCVFVVYACLWCMRAYGGVGDSFRDDINQPRLGRRHNFRFYNNQQISTDCLG